MMIVKMPTQTKKRKIDGLLLFLLTTTLFLTACVETSKSKAAYKLNSVQSALAIAKENNAHDYAPQALNEAEEKLRIAEVAIANKRHDIADELLEEALLGAKYADAKSEAERAKERVSLAKEMIDTLRKEILLTR